MVARHAGRMYLSEDASMRNPWMTKNPFMSAWLSSANRIAGAARGHANAATKRELASAQAEMSRQIIDFWASGSGLVGGRKRRR
ncbi:MAG: hypothetical protein ABIO45_12325 [Burkholderiaceae bacterium]